MNTTENNKLLAEFMGFLESSIPNQYWTEKSSEGFGIGELKELKFNTDWNWLMQVVEKIENLKTPIVNNSNLIGKNEDYEVHIQGKHVKIYAHGEVTKEIVDLRSSESNSKIEAVYNACVEFVKWYNQTK
jgi:hypothetical protein